MKAQILSAAAHPIRVEMLEHLRGGELCVGEIARLVGTQRPNASRHLGVLLRAGLVDCRKDGLNVFYSLKARCVVSFLDCVGAVLQRQASEASAILRSMR
jgi:ArsR family transcriptional regulator